MLLKVGEGVGIEHFCPFVAVVACGIATCHDVRELCSHAGAFHFGQHFGTVPGSTFKGRKVGAELVFQRVECHVEKSETDLSHACVCHIEVAAGDDAVEEFLRYGVACLVVGGERIEEVGLDAVVFHELRGQLNEVPIDVGA